MFITVCDALHPLSCYLLLNNWHQQSQHNTEGSAGLVSRVFYWTNKKNILLHLCLYPFLNLVGVYIVEPFKLLET